jgi:hypothetical protein
MSDERPYCPACTVFLMLLVASVALGAGVALGQATARLEQRLDAAESTPPVITFKWK